MIARHRTLFTGTGLAFGICAVAVCTHMVHPSSQKECKASLTASSSVERECLILGDKCPSTEMEHRPSFDIFRHLAVA
ncbi:hypothetical protein EDD22DRAFT_928946, partial [Suillus occidentalis]